MNKCEHGDKISIFCATDCCACKELGGCESCIKKYHNHIGPTIFVREDQLQNLIKKYQLDHTIKPKCRVLQEAIYNYFNLIKSQINSTIDLICKNIVNQIGYPFLFSNNALTSYKRLKNKQYKKLTQKQFKIFYQLSSKVNQKDLIKDQARIYLSQIKETSSILNSFQGMMNEYQKIAKSSNYDFVHDSSFITRINEIVKSLNNDSPLKNKTKSKDKQIKQSQYYSNQSKQTASQAKNESKNQNKPEIKVMVKLDLIKSFERQKDVSPSARFNKIQDSLEKRLIPEKFTTGKQKSLQNNGKIQNLKQQLNMKELEINQKKRQLLDMMKQKEESPKLKQSEKERRRSSLYKTNAATAKQAKQPGLVRKGDSSEKNSSINNLKLIEDDIIEAEDDKKVQNIHKNIVIAYTKLPLQQSYLRKLQQKEEAKKKYIPPVKQSLVKAPYEALPVKKNNISRPYEINSKQDQKNTSLLNNLQYKSTNLKRQEPSDYKENQEKSLALFFKSLSLKAEEAITYLQCALRYAENNLSAAQYLSFLYLQLNRPKECLQICNKMLDRFDSHQEYQDQSLRLHNNKAAALNVLGRYSESIVILQACLKYKQKDCLFKNLGDAYFSISIYDKATYNYERALKMNQNSDEAYYNLSVCNFVQGNYHHARQTVIQALKLQPKNQIYQQLFTNIQYKIVHG